jgi:hypothetical protein
MLTRQNSGSLLGRNLSITTSRGQLAMMGWRIIIGLATAGSAIHE